MRLSLPISLSLLLLSWQPARAQLAPADDFFNSGAQFYLSNNIAQAKQAVEAGLKNYPDDEKLKKLEQLLKQQSQQQQDKQQQDQKNQDQQNQQNQSQQQQKDQQSQQQKSDDQKNQQQNQQSSQQKSPEQQKQEDQKNAGQKKDEQQQDQKKSSPEKKDGGKPEDKNAESQPVAPGQMTPEEAKRLLDAQKGDEQVLKLQPNAKPEDQKKPVKDW
jgi:hypothetical protein